jgi:hypothetical protein
MKISCCRAAMLLVVSLFVSAGRVQAYIEVPYTLGNVIHLSTNIVVMKVERIDADKNLIYYKKVRDLKGKHPSDVVKHNIGKGGFHEREWKTVMAEAKVGRNAVLFHNGSASETCLGSYWYQCYSGGEWWTMNHADPYLLRTYCGDLERLAAAVTEIVAGKEVIIPCMRDGNKEDLHLRKGKLQRLRASLKLLTYDARRDFVGWCEPAADQPKATK